MAPGRFNLLKCKAQGFKYQLRDRRKTSNQKVTSKWSPKKENKGRRKIKNTRNLSRINRIKNRKKVETSKIIPKSFKRQYN